MEINHSSGIDFAVPAAANRSLIRRLLPWAASLGLFAGGGFGVYRYAAPPGAEAAAPRAASEAPATDRQEIRNLFGAGAAAASDRYASAPVLPPARDSVAAPRSAATLADRPSNDAGAAAGDRYGAAPSSINPFDAAAPVPAESPAPAAASAAADRAQPEIARGQEPQSANPLRVAASQPAAAPAPDDAEARAAFDQAAAAAPMPQVLDLTPKSRPAVAPPADAASSRYNAPSSAAQVKIDAAPAASDGVAALPAAPLAGASAAGGSRRPAELPPEPTRSIVASEPVRSPAAAPAAPPAAISLNATPASSASPTFAAEAIPSSGAAGAGQPGERILEGSQNPALTIQKLAPPEIQVGKKCTFAVRVHNGSSRPAHQVRVRDEAPAGTQLLGAAPRAEVNGSEVVWDLGTLSPGEERIVEMELLPTDEGELGSVATVTFAAQASAKTKCTRPQLALQLTAEPRVMIGQQHLVQIEISNPGSGDATGVMLLESVPPGVSHEAGPALEFEVGTLHAGESRRLELVLTAEQAGRVDNVMTAKADANLQATSSCEFEVLAPDLKVTVDGPQRRYLERPATYTVSVDNPGTASAKDVQLVTQLPRGLKFVSANNMGEYDAATHSVYWSLAELPASERGSVELTALPVEPGDHTLQVATRARQGLEDRAETHVTVEGLVALSFEVTAADGAIEVGGETSYEIRVTNQGSKAATNVQVVALLPEGLKPLAGQGETRTVVQGNRVQFAPLAQLAPKAEAKFRIQVQGLRAGDQRSRVQITTDEVREPITKEQSTHVYADE